MIKQPKIRNAGRRFRALIQQDGKTRTVYTVAQTTMDALCNLSDDSSLKDGPVTIILRAIDAATAPEAKFGEAA